MDEDGAVRLESLVLGGWLQGHEPGIIAVAEVEAPVVETPLQEGALGPAEEGVAVAVAEAGEHDPEPASSAPLELVRDGAAVRAPQVEGFHGSSPRPRAGPSPCTASDKKA